MRNNIIINEEKKIGDIITDSFQYLRYNFKGIIKALLIFTGPVLLILSGFLILFTYKLLTTYNSLILIGAVLLYLFFITLIELVIIEYITWDEKHGVPPTTKELFNVCKQDFLMLLWTIILNFIFLGMAFMMFFIPGIFLFLPLSLIPIIRVKERTGYFTAMDKCLTLIAGNWWKTLGMLIIVMFIVYSVNIALNIPYYIVFFVGMSHDVTTQTSGFYQILITATIFINVLDKLLLVIPTAALTFQYYNLVEKKEGLQLLKRIENIG